jgi:serine/threonine-protein kinase RsbW
VARSESGYCVRLVGGSKSGNSLDVELPAEPASCWRARDALRGALASLAVDIAAVDLAVTEAVTNVVVHAYRDRRPADGPGPIRIALRIEDDAAWVVVADDGVGMAPRADSPGLGMGLSLIASVCDELEIEQRHDGTRVHMRFGLGPDTGGAGPKG